MAIAAALAWLAWHFGLSPAARADWLVRELRPPNEFRLFLAKTRLMPLRRRDEVVAELAGMADLAIPLLTAAMKDEVADVRWFAAGALGGIGPGAGRAVPALIAAMRDEVADVRWLAAGALAGIGPAAKQVVPTLIAAMKDEDAGVRSSAAEALGLIGPVAAQAVPALEEMAKSKAPDLSAAARAALERIQGGQETHGP